MKVRLETKNITTIGTSKKLKLYSNSLRDLRMSHDNIYV